MNVAEMRRALNPEAKAVFDEIRDRDARQRVGRMILLEPALFEEPMPRGKRPPPDLYEGNPCRKAGHTKRIHFTGACYECELQNRERRARLKQEQAAREAQANPEPEWQPGENTGACENLLRMKW